MKNTIGKVLAGTAIVLSGLFSSGCQTVQQSNRPFSDRLGFGVDLGGEYHKYNIAVPERFGDIPAHPDDQGSKTRKVNLTSGECTYSTIGFSLSPLPVDNFFSNFQIGYRRSVPGDTANQIRDGLSKMEWYEYGAYAGTYTRIKVGSIDQFRVSYRQKFQFSDQDSPFVVLEGGFSWDTFQGDIEGGWDRYYTESPEVKENVKAKSGSPFISVGGGFQIDKGTPFSLNLSFKPQKYEGDTSYGQYSLKGSAIGLNARLGF